MPQTVPLLEALPDDEKSSRGTAMGAELHPDSTLRRARRKDSITLVPWTILPTSGALLLFSVLQSTALITLPHSSPTQRKLPQLQITLPQHSKNK